MFGHFATGVLEYALKLRGGLCEIRIWQFEPSTFSCLPRGFAVLPPGRAERREA